MRLGFWTAMALGVLAWARPALAHIDMMYPPMRGGDQKTGPCEGAARGEPTVLSPGETITVKWYETIDHDSHYRIAFDLDGEDGFAAPTDVDDLYNSDAVLVDDLPDKQGGSYEYELTLPNAQCETCTLQLIQVMYAGDSFAGNYFRCADIALRGESAPDAGAGSEPMSTGGGCQVGAAAGTGAAGAAASILLMLASVTFALRRSSTRARR